MQAPYEDIFELFVKSETVNFCRFSRGITVFYIQCKAHTKPCGMYMLDIWLSIRAVHSKIQQFGQSIIVPE